MSEIDPTSDPLTEHAELPIDHAIDLLRARPRRETLRRLLARGEPVSLADLAEAVATGRGPPSVQRRERVAIDLHHVHLPKLADAGLVHYDRESETVEAVDAASRVEPFLDREGDLVE